MKDKLEVGIVRGASWQDIIDKKFNIYVGISLGNKWFTRENIKKEILWSLKHSKDRVGILIGDTLHAINYEVRSRKTYENSIKKSLKKGDEVIFLISNLIQDLPKKDRDKIEIIRWDDLKRDPLYQKKLHLAQKEFKKNKLFRQAILNIIRKNVKQEDRVFTQKEIERLGNYIIDEIPQSLNGFLFNGLHYNCLVYPHDSDLTRFIGDLQSRKVFFDISRKLVERNNVFVELKVA